MKKIIIYAFVIILFVLATVIILLVYPELTGTPKIEIMATPALGEAPLEVTFKGSISANRWWSWRLFCGASSFSSGEGEFSFAEPMCVSYNFLTDFRPVSRSFNIKHAYKKAGEFNAVFSMNSLKAETKVSVTDNSVLPDMKDWQTYRNEEFGFEISIPNNILVLEESNSIYFRHDNYVSCESACPYGGIHIENIDSKYPTLASIKNDKSRLITWGADISFGGHPANQGISRETGIKWIYVMNNGKLYAIIWELLDPKILSTFKFIDNNNKEFETAHIKNISKQNNDYALTLGAVKYEGCQDCPDGYKTTNLNITKDFLVSSEANITVVSDTLSGLVWAGVLESDIPSKTVNFYQLMSLINSKGLKATDLISGLYDFKFQNGSISEINQRYLP